MEQGDQVIKSPWSSWQFGMNYFYESWGSTYKGSGDKAEKYAFNSMYTRSNWEVRNAMNSAESQRVGGKPLTPGSDSQGSWIKTGNISNGGVTVNKDTSIGSSTNGKRSWGLIDLEDLKEPTNEVEILARISPKEVTKQPISLNITEPRVETLEAPAVNPQVNTPLNAPNIKLPTIESVTINKLTINAPSTPTAPSAPEVPTITVSPSAPGSVTAPTINISVTPPSISTLNIVTPGNIGTISVTAPTVTPVDFILPQAALSSDSSRNFHDNSTYGLNGKDIDVNIVNLGSTPNTGNYISTWGRVKNLDGVTTNVTVSKDKTRAFMIDEGIDYRDSVIKPFRFTGTINLNASQNVGIDVQGTHTSLSHGGAVNGAAIFNNENNVANIKVINEGNIYGNDNAAGTIKNQVAFGFNNFDSSTNNTRTEMINRGYIKLAAKESAGIQLRPENPSASGTNNKLGLNMMTAFNETAGKIDINNSGSFGMLTVQNKNSAGTPAAPKTYSNYGITTLAGG